MRKVKKQSGFTLVEIAIVLVIIGLLLAGVLKGQELIESSRTKRMANDLTSFTAMITSYQDRYRGIPGDDAIATTTYSARWDAAAVTAVTSNGLIGAGADAAIFPAVATAENTMAIQALRYAGFLEGNGAVVTLPANAAGGLIALTNNVMGFGDVNVVCLSKLSGKQAGALDRLLDDGDNMKGSIRAILGTTLAAATPTTVAYADATPNFTLCKPV